MLALSAGVARAAPPKLVPYGKFAAESPFGVAVDQSSNDVYVAGFLKLSEEGSPIPVPVDKFDPSGKLISPPSPFGEGFHSGVAVNPTNGDVYVVDAVAQEIDTYDPNTGAPIPPFSVSGCAASVATVEIATDSGGNVYLPCTLENGVRVYSPSGTLLRTLTGSGPSALSGPTGVAVDASGNVWVGDDGDNRIEEFDATGVSITELKSEGVQAVALDTHGDVFALVDNNVGTCGSIAPPCDHVVEYGSAGEQLADLGAGEIESISGLRALLGAINTLAVDDSSGRVYVTDQERDAVWVFAPPIAPKLESELAVDIGTSEAKLGALVNPGGLDVAYRFEYDTREYHEGEGPHGVSVPFPEGDAGTGFTSRTVWAAAKGLAPGTTYHYRIVLTSALGTVVGHDQTFTTETAAQASCPNEQFRTAFSAGLPDCRAYELVTPPNKNSAQTDQITPNGLELALRNNFAADGGGRMAFKAEDILPGSRSAGEYYVATRGSSGWSSENESPPQNYYGFECSNNNNIVPIYSVDLSRALVEIGANPECGGPEPELVSGEPKGAGNLFVRDNTNGTYQLVNVTPQGVVPTNAQFAGASADLSHVVFTEEAKLTENALTGVANLYEWSDGIVRLVTVLAGETPVAGSFAGISADGSHIFFTAGGKLYARVDGEHTVQVDEPRGGAGSGSGGQFADVSADGSQVFFTDDPSAGLTKDTVSSSGTNLYRYDFGTSQLTDLTPGSNAEVRAVNGISKDGSYVYFEAEGSLVMGATEGQPNLYLFHGGTTTFIVTLSLNERIELPATKVPKDGAFLAFGSEQSLTGYDNTDADTGKSDPEIFLYDAAKNSIACASCISSGAAPTGGASLERDAQRQQARNLTETGRVFFDSSEALLPSDTNGQRDVYEFESDGVGSCVDPSGCVFLISTGTSSTETSFIDASANGDDVFLREYQKLVPQDKQEEAVTIYDARVDGGFPELATPPPCTTADACRSAPAPAPSIFGAPATQTFSGAGNVTPPLVAAKKTTKKTVKCKKGLVRKRGKCVRSRGKKKAKKSTTKKAGNGRRAKS